ncbi:flagellar operon protein TIGR03826 [Evansella caseinilytica]|uniref:Flagellar operon protein TIGR03826 n=1 Tax=Evansella caseinilytica TaxID=1503961 RepID=A0A1H3S862_9BACI|nr:TIGR03826 family flagellar region protein [Evansella caseinilytica]SDZ33319.1 flagellar operon protein TIGR03826 [Evansella caseinilytica]
MADLANCPNCGKVFVKALRPVCDACYREVEEKFDTVYTFIRKSRNRSATIDQVCEETGVEKDLIIRFIREGRLQLSQFPNLGYPCEKCGESTREGRLCSKCKKEINDGLREVRKSPDREERKPLRHKSLAAENNDLPDLESSLYERFRRKD